MRSRYCTGQCTDLTCKSQRFELYQDKIKKADEVIDYDFETHCRNILELINTDAGEIFDFEDGKVTIKKKIDPKAIKAIKKVTQTVRTTTTEDGAEYTDTKTTFEMYSRLDAIKTLGTVLGYNPVEKGNKPLGEGGNINNFYIQLNQAAGVLPKPGDT